MLAILLEREDRKEKHMLKVLCTTAAFAAAFIPSSAAAEIVVEEGWTAGSPYVCRDFTSMFVQRGNLIRAQTYYGDQLIIDIEVGIDGVADNLLIFDRGIPFEYNSFGNDFKRELMSELAKVDDPDSDITISNQLFGIPIGLVDRLAKLKAGADVGDVDYCSKVEVTEVL